MKSWKWRINLGTDLKSSIAERTIAFLLPACIAFIVFSSSLLGLIKGKVSPTALLGIGLIVLVSLIPVVYRRLKGRQAAEVEAE